MNNKVWPFLFIAYVLFPITGRRLPADEIGAMAKTQTVQKMPPPPKNIGPLVVMIDKSDGTLALVYEQSLDTLLCYPVRVGLNPGQKTRQGDKKTPVGEYKIVGAFNSKYVRFLTIDYPNAADRAAGRTGGRIGIHYLGREMIGPRTRADGSSGCITVWDKAQIWRIDSLVGAGTRVMIRE